MLLNSSNQAWLSRAILLVAITFWGSSFIISKELINHGMSIIEILLLRFTIGYVVLLGLTRGRLTFATPFWKECYYALGGFLGITLYYMCESISLKHLPAWEVSLLVCTAPIFTALIRAKSLSAKFIVGSAIALLGIFLVEANAGSSKLSLNVGVLVAFGGAVSWAAFSHVGKWIGSIQSDSLMAARRMFFWGILFMLPLTLYYADESWTLSRIFTSAVNGWHTWDFLWRLLYLGTVTSGLCYAAWAYAVRQMGPIKASLYLYINPVVAVIFAWLILNESPNILQLIGSIFVLIGVCWCEFSNRIQP